MIKGRKNTKKRLHKGKKLEAKKPLFTATEHTVLTGSSNPTEAVSFSFPTLVTKSTP